MLGPVCVASLLVYVFFIGELSPLMLREIKEKYLLLPVIFLKLGFCSCGFLLLGFCRITFLLFLGHSFHPCLSVFPLLSFEGLD